jgi:hypothetical protein
MKSKSVLFILIVLIVALVSMFLPMSYSARFVLALLLILIVLGIKSLVKWIKERKKH